MRTLSTTAFSMLDLVPVRMGGSVAQALHNSLDMARHVERLGFTRFWLAEHHNMDGIASSATAVLIGHVAGGTTRIRVGSGGVMLPNHAPLVVAENFGTLATLYPDRIDLGLGRAPGTDPQTMRALRRDRPETEDDFPQQVLELQAYLAPARPGQRLIAMPGAGTEVPIWLLGSSLFSAQLAAQMGLPFAFASHFAPAMMMQAIDIYRGRFKPSDTLQKPYVMIGASIYAADTDAEGARLFTSMQQQFLNMLRGVRGQLLPPVDSMDGLWLAEEKAHIDQSLSCAVVGSPASVQTGLKALIERTGADEIMLAAQIFDHSARLRSFEIAAEVRNSL